MPEPIAAGTQARRRVQALATVAAAALMLAVLAALPTVPASAGASPQVSVPPNEQVEQLLGETPLGSLPTAELTEQLSELPAFEGIEPGALETAVREVIEALSSEGKTLEELLGGGEGAEQLAEKLSEALGLLKPQLEELLGGDPQQKLEEALGSSSVSELLAKLLGGSTEPQVLLEQILQAIGPEKLQSLLGTVLSGAPVVQSTVEQLAGQLGTSPEALAGQFAKTPEELPPAAMALIAPLANGEKLSVLNGPAGMTLGIVKQAGETVGATGGNGAPGAPGPSTTVTTTTTTPAPGAPSAGVAGVKAGKVKVLSRRFSRHRATIVVQVPSAGVLTVSGKGLKKSRREAAKAERITLHPALSRAASSSVRRHHRHVRVPVKVSFKPVGGAASSATVPLVYR
jgi:hypothetical protein